jgi:Tol biopolymer transport system component
MNADGTSPRVLRAKGDDGAVQQSHAEWSPDGTQIVLMGATKTTTQIFIIDAGTGDVVRQVTDRPGPNIDPSWSPGDPDNILFVGCPSVPCSISDYEIYRVPVKGGTETRLTFNGRPSFDPYASRNGNSIAWEERMAPPSNSGQGYWDAWLMAADGSNQRNVTNSSLSISTGPQWSSNPPDAWIYLHHVHPPDSHFGVYRMSPDRPNFLQPVAVDPSWNNEYPSQ